MATLQAFEKLIIQAYVFERLARVAVKNAKPGRFNNLEHLDITVSGYSQHDVDVAFPAALSRQRWIDEVVIKARVNFASDDRVVETRGRRRAGDRGG